MKKRNFCSSSLSTAQTKKSIYLNSSFNSYFDNRLTILVISCPLLKRAYHRPVGFATGILLHNIIKYNQISLTFNKHSYRFSSKLIVLQN